MDTNIIHARTILPKAKKGARVAGMEQATVEPSQANIETPIEQGKRKAEPFFNKENAKLYAAQATEARKQAAIARQQAIEAARAVTELAPSEEYRLNRLARVRAQLALVDEQVENLIKSPRADQSRLKGLVEAQDRLSEQERKLAGRALPGSHRPSKSPSPKPSTIEPSE